jgi:hypothetical protein
MTRKIASAAFHRALLRTECLRILGSILVISIFALTAAIRIFLFGSHVNHNGLYGAVVFVGYEFLVLRAVQRSIDKAVTIPDWFWTINVIIEMSMPSLAAAFLVSNRIIPEYRPLANTWVVLFFRSLFFPRFG